MTQARHQVGQRLTRTGAGLDGKMLTGIDRMRYRRRHRELAGPLGTAQRLHRRAKQFGDIRKFIGH